MKILFYNHTNEVSGAERVMLLLLARLDRDRFSPVLLCPPNGSLQREARALNVSCIDVKQLDARFTWSLSALLRYCLSFLNSIREVRRCIRAQAPQLIHANSVRAGLVISTATLGMRIPVVWHVHDLLPSHPLSTLIRLFTLLRPPARIVVVANAAAERFKGKLLSRFPKRVKIDVIYNAIDTNGIQSTAMRSAIRRELRIRSNDRLIGIVGNLSPVKRQLELIRAFAETRKQNCDLVLLIVGSALFNRSEGYQKQLVTEARALGIEPYVRFLGQRNDVPAIMSALDMLVLNSLSEACPLVALEGMAIGVPILATAVGGVPELITHQETGWLVPLADETKLTAGIETLLKRPAFAAELAARASEHVKLNFPVQKFVTAIEAIYTGASVQNVEQVKQPLPALSLEVN